MLKARVGSHVLFGLSNANIEKLKQGKPIRIDLAEIGLSGTIVIFAGDTEESMMRLLDEHGFIGPETKIISDADPGQAS